MKLLNLVLLLFLVVSCSSEKSLVKIDGKTMGTYYKVIVFSDENPGQLKKDIDQFLKYFNDIFSTYIPDSEISRINKSKFDSIKLSDSMKKMIELSTEISRKSHGYFDITVGPIVNLWGFGPGGKQKRPSLDQVNFTLKNVGYTKLKVQDGRLSRPVGMYLDMSAIAKGFGVDELVKFLEFRGHANLLVEIGGEIRTRGQKPDGTNWKVGIEGPSKELGSSLVKVISLDNLSMATSGSYRNYVKYGDQVFNHTINTKTGFPIEHKTVSVSVVSEYCADADAWATALMSMGYEKGIELANKLDLPTYFQYLDKNNQLQSASSVSFKKLFNN